MARGKYERVAKHRHRKKKTFSLFLSIVLLLTLATGGTLAYIITKSAMAQNQFVKGSVTSSVNESGTVTNNGNVDAIKPNCTVTPNAGWTEIGGFYYYTSPVVAGGTTTTAPATVNCSDAAPSSVYSLSIETVAEAIQAEGTLDSNDSITAVFDAWGVTPGSD